MEKFHKPRSISGNFLVKLSFKHNYIHNEETKLYIIIFIDVQILDTRMKERIHKTIK